MSKQIEKVIATHDGSFHADDVFAYAILSSLFEHKLIRSRKEERLDTADIVFDVGGGKYDHHSTDKVYRKNGIPYAAFGLIWRDFGKEFLLKSELIEEEHINAVHKKIDRDFVQAIDAFDNGVNLSTDTVVKVQTISSVIGGFNHHVKSDGTSAKKIETLYFLEATAFARQILMNEIVGISNQLEARAGIEEAFANRENPQILILDSPAEWGDTVEELDINEEVLYVIYPKIDAYYIQVVRKDAGTFEARKDLPEEWAGKRDEAFNQVLGIDDGIFCHPARFLAGAKSKESILKMAELALQA